jgi:hypothetical protein
MHNKIEQVSAAIGHLACRQGAQNMSCGMREMPRLARIGDGAGVARTVAKGHSDNDLPVMASMTGQ